MLAPHSSPIQTLLAPLKRLDALELGRPASMTLDTYLARLEAMSLLSSEAVETISSVYHALRFARAEVSSEESGTCVAWLQEAASTAEAATPEQRAQWTEILHPPPPSEPDADPDADQTEAESGSSAFTEAPVADDAEPTEDDTLAPTTSEEKDAGRVFVTEQSAPPPPEGALRRFFRRSLTFHLFWLLPLVLFGSVMLLWTGAKHSRRLMLTRYRLQNRMAQAFGFSTVTIPSRYLPRRMRPRYRRRRAIRRFTRYIVRRHPNNARLWRRLASHYNEKDRYAQAIAFYLRSLSLEPNHAETLNDLAWLLCTADNPEYRDPIRALQLAERAYRLKKIPDIIDTLAEAAFLNGQRERAIRLEKEALAMKPRDPSHYKEQLRRFQQSKASKKDDK